MGRDGLVISLREPDFCIRIGYAEGRGLAHVAQDCGLAGSAPYDVRIEGHTDNVPIHDANFASNWSFQRRGNRIARLFLEVDAIPPERLSAAGYGEFHPVASNVTAEAGKEPARGLVVMPRMNINFAAGRNRRAGPGGRLQMGMNKRSQRS